MSMIRTTTTLMALLINVLFYALFMINVHLQTTLDGSTSTSNTFRETLFPSDGILKKHRRNLCSTCGFDYSSRWTTCCRSQGPSRCHCEGLIMTAPEQSAWLKMRAPAEVHLPESSLLWSAGSDCFRCGDIMLEPGASSWLYIMC